ncbi:hypothetical protein CRE_09914 [Caenorhabditis remanei]|uniref:PAZ domain-containing protein n=1 Tax=Caenorhabditis remanei TaxID=31234 RepID=E3NQC1_CAERE|nr:hypothetical protein CRE_09914 [Caenorhabditis remanei]
MLSFGPPNAKRTVATHFWERYGLITHNAEDRMVYVKTQQGNFYPVEHVQVMPVDEFATIVTTTIVTTTIVSQPPSSHNHHRLTTTIVSQPPPAVYNCEKRNLKKKFEKIEKNVNLKFGFEFVKNVLKTLKSGFSAVKRLKCKIFEAKSQNLLYFDDFQGRICQKKDIFIIKISHGRLCWSIAICRIGSGEGDYEKVRQEVENMKGYSPKFLVVFSQRNSQSKFLSVKVECVVGNGGSQYIQKRQFVSFHIQIF